MKSKTLIVTTGIFFLSFACIAQTAVIQGKVVDAVTQTPLPFANVFIDNTTIGTTTDNNGNFKLTNINYPGSYELVISFVGYDLYRRKVTVNDAVIDMPLILLTESKVQLSDVSVKGSKDKEWEKNLKKFKKIFLGTDSYAARCTIGNPWVIDFSEENKVFTAVATAPIEVQNDALGYKLQIHLVSFTSGIDKYRIEVKARFEELKPKDQKEQATWDKNRLRAYLQSRQHLFKAIVERRIWGEGFDLYGPKAGAGSLNYRSAAFSDDLGKKIEYYDTAALLSKGTKAGQYSINIKKRMEVHYRFDYAPIVTYTDIKFPVSWIEPTKEPIRVTQDGHELNPDVVFVSGAMNENRIGRMLPRDYTGRAYGSKIDVSDEQKRLDAQTLFEHIYVQTDRSFYYPGEQCWFKGNIRYANPDIRDSLSQVAYVELISEKNQVVITQKHKIDSGFFKGTLKLPDTLHGGTYRMRIYTWLNRNFGDDNLYMKIIPVLERNQFGKTNANQTEVSENIKVASDKPVYQTREKIKLDFISGTGDHAASVVAVSVTDLKQVPVFDTDNIQSVYKKEIPPFDVSKMNYAAERGLSFTGQYYLKNEAAVRTPINIMETISKVMIPGVTNDRGMFSVSDLAFYDTATFIVLPQSKRDVANGIARLVSPTIPKISSLTYKPDFIKIDSATVRARVLDTLDNGAILLKNVDVKGEKISETDEIYRSKRPYGRPDIILKGSDIARGYANLLVAIQGKFPGVIVAHVAENEFSEARWVVYEQRAKTRSGLRPIEVQLMINDIAQMGRPADILALINPETVTSVEYKSSVATTYASVKRMGILSVYTKLVVDAPTKTVKGQMLRVRGYEMTDEFVSPDYSTSPTKGGNDYRSLIYWNPDVKTDSSGKASVSFYAADIPTTYRIVVEGLNAANEPVRCVKYVRVGN